MFKSILPQNRDFFDFFEQHSALIVQAANVFLELTKKGGDLREGIAQIKKLEHQADDVTHRCTDALHRTFITPMDRNEIHSLIKRMDDIIDAMDAVSSRMGLYDITEIRPEAVSLADILVRASAEVDQAVRGLRNMKNADTIGAHCIALHRLENEGDEILRAALARLFREETQAVLVIKWKEIYERLEKATDRCEEVANIIEGVVIEAT